MSSPPTQPSAPPPLLPVGVRLGLLVVAVLAALAAALLARPAPVWLWLVVAAGALLLLTAGGGIFWHARRPLPRAMAIPPAMPTPYAPPQSPPPAATPALVADERQIQEISTVVAQMIELARTGTAILERQRAALDALHQARMALPRSVVYDPLTGAVTHTALMTRLATDVPFAVQHQRPLALIVCDIDDFRAINTRYGYRFGDEVLCTLAERIRTRLAEGDLLARLGGDRFAILRAGADFPQVQGLVEQIRAAVHYAPLLVLDEASPLPGHQEPIQVTLRVGVALCPDDGATAAALLAAAIEPLAHPMRHNVLHANALRAEPAPAPLSQAVYEAQAGDDLPTADARAPSGPAAGAWHISYIDAMMQKYTSIHALTAAMEAQEVTSVTEARTLAELAQETALLLGRSIEEARLVGLAALLHDVGNLGIPAAILQKTEALTAEEWAFVREHPHLGERLLTSVGGVLAAIAPIVAAQRERWDGLGYPAGLRGTAIPLGARIVAVCDVYGALIAARPYRPARSPAEALIELERNAGTQFDPDVVRAFITAATTQ